MGDLFKVGASIYQGREANKAAKEEAKQLERRAGSERASSQRSAAEQKREARLVQSRALALAASSGAGASDPTIVNMMADIEGEGEYRALTELYVGEERARGDEAAAKARRREGKVARNLGYLKAASTIFDSAKKGSGGA